MFSERRTCPHTTAWARMREKTENTFSLKMALCICKCLKITGCHLSGRNRKFKLLTWYFKLATDAVTPQNGFIGGVDIKQELGRC